MGGEKKKTALERVLGLYTSTKLPFRYGAWVLSILAVLALVYLLFSLRYLDRVYPNVVIGENDFGGLTSNQLKDRLNNLVNAQDSQKITLKQGDKSFELTSKDIEWQVDVEATTNKIFNYGRDGNNRLTSFFHQLKSPFLKTRLVPSVSFDAELLAAKISEIADKVNNPAQNASAQLVSDKLVVTNEKNGEIVDAETVNHQTLEMLNGFSSGTIEMEKLPDIPKIVLINENFLNTELEKLSVRKLTIKWETGSKILSRKEIRQLVGFVGEVQPLEDNAPANATNRQVLTAKFTAEKVQNYLTSISDLTDSPAVEPQLVIKDGQLSIVKNSKEGRIVDLRTSSEKVLKALETQGDNPIVELTLKTDTPIINESNLASLGIKERIGYGETNMAGSPANRRHNVQNGVTILSSALIKPGEIFSTVGKLGAVDNTTGFLPELVIKENRTTPEFGGGLCQVSTTLFRSVLNAGLKVTERQNHSYRVSYYEPPVGLDATIYLPKPDLKFLNDTPANILVQGRVVGNKVIFELWGTSDGRTSSTTAPIVTNVVQPGEPIYAETDTLPKGEQKQIEKPHAGATAVVTYTVTRNGQVINKQVFKSIYKVWPARFLVGTNESLPPTTP